jgi:hypothetical protein
MYGGLGQRLARRRIHLFRQNPLEAMRLLDTEPAKVAVACRGLKGSDGRDGLIHAGLGQPLRFAQKKQITALDPLILGMMLSHGFPLPSTSDHSDMANGSLLGAVDAP